MDKKYKILAVDDDPEILSVIRDIFPTKEFRVICSNDGYEAGMKFRNEEFDLIISDIKMPKVNGIEFVQTVRKTKPNLPIFFISASVEDYSSELELFERITILGKPFKPHDMLFRVRDALSVKAVAQNNQVIEDMSVEEGIYLTEEGSESKDLYLVKEGRFGLYRKNSSGQSILLGEVGPGEIVGGLSTLLNGKQSFSVLAMTSSRVVRIPPERTESVMNAQPKWFKVLLGTLSGRMEELVNRLADKEAS